MHTARCWDFKTNKTTYQPSRLSQFKKKDSDKRVGPEAQPWMAKTNRRKGDKVSLIQSEVFQKLDFLVMCPILHPQSLCR